MYINVGTRHCVKNVLLKVQELTDSIDLGCLFFFLKVIEIFGLITLHGLLSQISNIFTVN